MSATFSRPPASPPSNGAAMDKQLPRRRGKAIVIGCALAIALAGAAAALWSWMPRGLAVPASELRVARVERGIFLDEIVVRASAAPLKAVILDSVESGRVEEVYARDGALVQKGQLLFRISNPQRNLDLLARQADRAQQISNLSTLRLSQQASRSEHQRRLDDLTFALEQARKQHARNVRLAAQGFIASVALEESADKLEQQQHALAQEQRADAAEASVRRDALDQLDAAIEGLSAGLKLLGATVDALAVRAPAAGRLTDFRLQVGESIATGQNVGRIAVGRHGSVTQDGREYPVDISTIYPQITDGRFAIELHFTQEQPTLRPGQSLDVQLTLGRPAPALLLPNGAYINDSGGVFVYRLSADGREAERRAVRIGRRSNAQIEVLAGLAAGERVIVSGYAAYGNSPKLQISQ